MDELGENVEKDGKEIKSIYEQLDGEIKEAVEQLKDLDQERASAAGAKNIEKTEKTSKALGSVTAEEDLRIEQN
jgi:hypothetical protein